MSLHGLAGGSSGSAAKRTMALVGDSHAALSLTPPSTAWLMGGSIMGWFHVLSKFKYTVLGSVAVAGTRTDQIATTVDAAIALKPGYIVESSPTNDVAQGIAFSVARANRRAYWDKIRAAGIRLIILIGPPAGNITLARNIMLGAHRDDAYAYAHANPGVIIWDVWALTVDPASAISGPKSALMRADNIHVSDKGAYALAPTLVAFDAATNPFPDIRSEPNPIASYTLDPNSIQIHGNPLQTGAGIAGSGPFSGTCAKGWTVSRSGTGTGVLSAPAGSLGVGFAAQCVYTAVSGDTLAMSGLSTWDSSWISAGLSVGAATDRYIVLRIRRIWSGMVAVKSATLTFGLRKVSDGLTLASYADFSAEASSTYYPQDDRTEWVETRPLLLPAGETINLITITQNVIFDGAGGCTLKLEQPNILDVTADYTA